MGCLLSDLQDFDCRLRDEAMHWQMSPECPVLQTTAAAGVRPAAGFNETRVCVFAGKRQCLLRRWHGAGCAQNDHVHWPVAGSM